MLKKILAVVAVLYAAASFAAVDVNKASAAELDGIKGIGPAMSSKILDERKKGNFKDWNDFVGRVNGVGPASATKLSTEGLTVNGDSFSGAAASKKMTDKSVDAKASKGSSGPTSMPAAMPAPAKPADSKMPAASAAKK